ncbi:MAG: diguanylate cyclase [Syntrophorhabdaceae bacterium]|nr:diguanylate cyclase [Syntrophorhabdaceae bacterium]
MKEKEKTVFESRRFLMTLLSNLPGMVYRCLNDKNWTMEFVSMGSIKVTGYTPEELVNNGIITYNEIIHPDDREMVWEEIQKSVKEKKHFEVTYRIIAKNGSLKWVMEYGQVVSENGSDPVVLEGYIADVTKRKIAEDELKRKTAFLEALVKSSPDAILVVDENRQVIIQNQRYIDMRKMPPEIVNEKDDHIRVKYLTEKLRYPEKFVERINYLYEHPEEISCDVIEQKDGTFLERYSSPIFDDKGTYYGRIWTFRDITEIKKYQFFLESISLTDYLTGVSNRRRFDSFIHNEWLRAIRIQHPLSLIMIDIDFFKNFNDYYGHVAGDECLRQIAQVLSNMVKRASDLLARYGGEEFACVLPDTDNDGAYIFAQKLKDGIRALSIPHAQSSVASYVTVSMGIATMVPKQGQSESAIIEAADKALYEAKQKGRNLIVRNTETVS